MDFNNDSGLLSNVAAISSSTDTVTIQGTGAIALPVGATSERPTLVNGLARYNTTTGYVEVVSGGAWVNVKDVTGLPVGGAAGDVLTKNSATDFDASFSTPTTLNVAGARRLIAWCKNDTLATIPKGTPVYETGNAGSSFTILVRPADAADPLKMPAIGILNVDLPPAVEGEMLILGEIQGVNTSTFTGGDEVYVAAGGGYTNVKPTSANVAVQFLGIVTKIHATNGGGYITGTGTVDLFRDGGGVYYGWSGTQWDQLATLAHNHTLDNLTDVIILNPVADQALTFNGTNWINANVSALSGNIQLVGDVTGSGVIGGNTSVTLNTVNGNVGVFGSATQVPVVTVNAKGLVTGVSNVAIASGGVGTVSSVSVVTANGLAGTVATPTSSPAITLSTTVTGMLIGNGTAISAAIPGTDFVVPTVGAGVGLKQISTVVVPASGTTNKIDSNTAPVITDGTQIWTQAVTPATANSKFTIDGSFYIDHNTNNRRMVVSIWRTVGAVNTLVGVSAAFITASNNGGEISISFYDVPATTSTITYSLRAFANGAGTWYVAQGSTAVFAGNLGKQIIRLTESS